MAAEDYVNLDSYFADDDIGDDIDWDAYQEDVVLGVKKVNYTDKFTFNGRRLRTKRQKQLVKSNEYIHGYQE